MKASTSPVNMHVLCPHGEHWYSICNLLDRARVADGGRVEETGVGAGAGGGGGAEEHRRFRLESI